MVLNWTQKLPYHQGLMCLDRAVCLRKGWTGGGGGGGSVPFIPFCRFLVSCREATNCRSHPIRL